MLLPYTVLPDLSEALRLGSVNLPGCMPAVEDEEGEEAAGLFHSCFTNRSQCNKSAIVSFKFH